MKIKHLTIFIPYFLYSCLIFSQDSLTRSMPVGQTAIDIDTVEYSNGVVYVGNLHNKARHGFGSLVSPFGDTLYVGNYQLNQRDGTGKYFFKNKNVYEGDWEKGAMHGVGKMHYANGDTYEGEWKEDRKHGFGSFTYKNGDIYVGDFVNGIREGKGKMSQKTQVYDGDWVKGAREGKGNLIIDAGGSKEEYVGGFTANRYNGHGTWKYTRGDIITEYIGNWVNGDRIGEGQYIINGRTLEGNWKRNEATGTGVGVGGEGIYEGEFYRGFFQGEGKFTYGSGEVYEGAWIRGKRQGYGVLSYTDGSRYEGYWHMDLQNGEGTIIASDGSKKIGKFKDGELEE
ncbi:MAG: hypothetical protein R8P61_14175 [Bacteroidia bacterium]|nr:hypothetical protein [Bacteroidia bacterium]